MIASQCDVDIADIILDRGLAVQCDAEIFGVNCDAVSIPMDRNLAVHALLIFILPGVPSRKIPCMVNDHFIFGMRVGFPGFPIQAQEQELAIPPPHSHCHPSRNKY